MKRRLLAILAICLLWLGGCSTQKVPTSADYYSQGEYLYGHHIYKGAIENYQHLVDQYPFSPLAEEAELKIGLTYYRMEDYPEAISSFSDFVRMHPMNKELAMATYYLGMSYFKQMHGPTQDQSNTEAAIEQFRTLELRYPESDFAELAHQRIEVCRESLATSEYLIGQYYAKRANFPAAESRLAELMEKYPETPVAPQALYDLGMTLAKEGKKYSAAQAFTAIETDYGKTIYASKAKSELKKLNQPVDTEEDPLRLVLAESGYGPPQEEPPLITVKHHETQTAANDATQYGADGLTLPGQAPASATTSDPAVLRDLRLASSPNPVSIIFDMSATPKFEKHFDGAPDSSTLTVLLQNTQPDSKLGHHMVFDRSIFRDAEIDSNGHDTTVTIHTTHVARFAIIPLEEPSRLLVTFTTEAGDLGQGTDQANDQTGDTTDY
jgi:outer membrane protein assembly factor BamD